MTTERGAVSGLKSQSRSASRLLKKWPIGARCRGYRRHLAGRFHLRESRRAASLPSRGRLRAGSISSLPLHENSTASPSQRPWTDPVRQSSALCRPKSLQARARIETSDLPIGPYRAHRTNRCSVYATMRRATSHWPTRPEIRGNRRRVPCSAMGCSRANPDLG